MGAWKYKRGVGAGRQGEERGVGASGGEAAEHWVGVTVERDHGGNSWIQKASWEGDVAAKGPPVPDARAAFQPSRAQSFPEARPPTSVWPTCRPGAGGADTTGTLQASRPLSTVSTAAQAPAWAPGGSAESESPSVMAMRCRGESRGSAGASQAEGVETAAQGTRSQGEGCLGDWMPSEESAAVTDASSLDVSGDGAAQSGWTAAGAAVQPLRQQGPASPHDEQLAGDKQLLNYEQLSSREQDARCAKLIAGVQRGGAAERANQFLRLVGGTGATTVPLPENGPLALPPAATTATAATPPVEGPWLGPGRDSAANPVGAAAMRRVLPPGGVAISTREKWPARVVPTADTVHFVPPVLVPVAAAAPLGHVAAAVLAGSARAGAGRPSAATALVPAEEPSGTVRQAPLPTVLYSGLSAVLYTPTMLRPRGAEFASDLPETSGSNVSGTAAPPASTAPIRAAPGPKIEHKSSAGSGSVLALVAGEAAPVATTSLPQQVPEQVGHLTAVQPVAAVSTGALVGPQAKGHCLRPHAHRLCPNAASHLPSLHS
jgi:hypothetical protein